MPLWQRLVIVGVVLFVTTVVARMIDRRIAGRNLPPEAITRYRVVRRSVTTTIMFVGLLSALGIFVVSFALILGYRALITTARRAVHESLVLGGASATAERG